MRSIRNRSAATAALLAAALLIPGLPASAAKAAAAAPANLALGRTASQSSLLAGYESPAERAVDGNVDGEFWNSSVAHTDQQPQAWWQVDLERKGRIGAVDLWNRTDCCISRLADFYLLVSDNPIVSTDLATARKQRGVSSYHVDLVARKATVPVDRTGRYVRVQLAGTGYLALAEVQVWDGKSTPPPALRNLAAAAQTSQSSVESGGAATRAQDGITSGVFSSATVTQTKSERQPWWQADLRATTRVSSVVLWNRTDCCADRLADFYLLTSATPFASTDLATVRKQRGVQSFHVSKLAGPSQEIKVNRDARYVRVQRAGTGYLSLAEVQVFGTERISGPDVAGHIRKNQFGMFIHYGPGTYTNEQWSPPNTPPSVFNPSNLDTDQWARAAVSAGMTYGVLTAKHHDGFALWDTASNNYDVAASPYRGDVVRNYADSFRRAGLEVGLYFSIWDRTNGDSTELAINQIRELLTGYGPINQIWFDAWTWGPGYRKITYEPIRDFIRNVSPKTVIINNDKMDTLATSDVIEYEDGRPPAGLTKPVQMSDMISTSNWDWFHTDSSVAPRSTEDIVAEVTYERDHGYQYLLNVGPSRDGRMDQVYTDRLAEVGRALKTTP
jgi:alpha-L-fucosidase